MCVLLVEDEPVLLVATELYLELAGFEVVTAQHGQQAFDHIDQLPARFTCLVTDYHMPGGITGADVILYMRPSYPLIPMFLTSADSKITSQEWRDEHIVSFLAKPYDPDKLVMMIVDLLH